MSANKTLVDIEALPRLFPHRIARASELMNLGLASQTVYYRCRPGGPWQRLLPGIILLSNTIATREQLIQSALRYAEPYAVLTGRDALYLHGILREQGQGPVHVLIPHTRQVRSNPTVLVERTHRMPISTKRHGFTVVPLDRAALDTTRQCRTQDDVRHILAETVQRGRLTPAELLSELNKGSNRGSALARKTLIEISDGVRSPAEAWARKLIQCSDLPQPQWNVPVKTENGTLLGVIDAWWDDVALAWEIDSYAYHFSAPDYAATVKRGSQLTAAGIIVVHTLPTRLKKEPKAVLDELRQTYFHAACRPRPRLIVG